jgi:hypothetical protein
MCSPDNPDLGKADFGQRAPAFLVLREKLE